MKEGNGGTLLIENRFPDWRERARRLRTLAYSIPPYDPIRERILALADRFDEMADGGDPTASRSEDQNSR